MHNPDLQIVATHETPAGRQKARILTVMAPTATGVVRFRVKWRALSTAHGLNDPRKELVAYAFQKLFLDPEDYVVPPTVGHCFDIDQYRRHLNPKERSTFLSVSCVFGTMSYWLEDAKDLKEAERAGWLSDDKLFDHAMFDGNATYRRTLADMNVLNHLIGNGDTHAAQFVFTASGANTRVYCVDFTISFSPYRNPTLKEPDDWSVLHVPALAHDSVERLRRLRRSDLERLAVTEEYEIREGRLVSTRPGLPGGNLDAGLRWWRGKLQAGLTRREIDYVWQRIEKLRESLEHQQVAFF
jgi:hypothetical protein